MKQKLFSSFKEAILQLKVISHSLASAIGDIVSPDELISKLWENVGFYAEVPHQIGSPELFVRRDKFSYRIDYRTGGGVRFEIKREERWGKEVFLLTVYHNEGGTLEAALIAAGGWKESVHPHDSVEA